MDNPVYFFISLFHSAFITVLDCSSADYGLERLRIIVLNVYMSKPFNNAYTLFLDIWKTIECCNSKLQINQLTPLRRKVVKSEL